MTQNQLKILTLLSLALFAISVFNLLTIIAFGSVLCFSYLYLQRLIKKQIQRGLIELLPRRVQDGLLHRSVFELICQSWLYEALKFLKIAARPFLDPHDPENAIQAFEGVNSQDRNKYLAKGIFRMMPYSFQKILLGRQRMQRLENHASLFDEYPKDLKERDSQRNTDDQSQKQIPRMKSIDLRPTQVVIWKQEKEINLPRLEKEMPLIEVNNDQKQVEPCDSKVKFAFAKRRFFKIARDSVGMLKNLIQIHTLGQRIQKMSTGTIIKLAIIFWIILIAQMKFSKDTRRIVLKTGYVIGGIISIFGTVATTGALVYKQCRKDRRNELRIQK